MLLGARGPVPYREIRSQFKAYQTENDEAGLRAFERDKADLLELGIPLRYVTPEDDETVDEAGYVVDLRRYRMPEIRLTPEEVAALVLAGSVARAAHGTTYAEVVDLTLKKLAFDLPTAPDTPTRAARGKAGEEHGKAAPVLVHFPEPASPGLAERLSLLEQATRNRKRLTLSYLGTRDGVVSARDVDPYGLAYRQGAWLLVAYCHLRKGVRTFRLDRISEVTVAPKPRTPDFERPSGFDVRRHADRSPWTYEMEPPVEVVLEVLPPASAIANEDFGGSTHRQAGADGATLIRFECSNPDYLVSRVMAAKGGIIVRAPTSIRERVRDEIRAVAARYQCPGASQP